MKNRMTHSEMAKADGIDLHCSRHIVDSPGAKRAVRPRNMAANRSREVRIWRGKAWMVLGGLRNGLWKLADKAIKAFFDAFFDHLSRV